MSHRLNVWTKQPNTTMAQTDDACYVIDMRRCTNISLTEAKEKTMIV